MNEAYCLKCKSKRTWKGKPKLGRTRNDRVALVGKCYNCNSKMMRFVGKNEMKGDGLLSNLIGKPIPVLSKIPLLNILF